MTIRKKKFVEERKNKNSNGNLFTNTKIMDKEETKSKWKAASHRYKTNEQRRKAEVKEQKKNA